MVPPVSVVAVKCGEQSTNTALGVGCWLLVGEAVGADEIIGDAVGNKAVGDAVGDEVGDEQLADWISLFPLVPKAVITAHSML